MTGNTKMTTSEIISKNKRIKKARQRRRLFIMRLAAALMFFTVLGSVFSSSMYAKADHEEAHSEKFYKSILICEGDTLTSIANRYYSDEFKSVNAYINEVKYINGLADDSQIYADGHLIVPYYAIVSDNI